MREKEKPQISVIIPVYNTESYVETCVRSVCGQTWKNLEILLIDDGSTDTSGEICERYAGQDARIHVVHQKNGGIGAARNAGLERMKGEYFMFADSDDILAPDLVELLYRDIEWADADLACCGWAECSSDEALKDKRLKKILSKEAEAVCMSGREALKEALAAEKITVSAVCKLYRTRVFETFRYPAGVFWEDAYVIVELLLRCRRVTANPSPRYVYRHRSNSVTMASYTRRDLDVFRSWKRQYELVAQYCPEYLPEVKMRFCFSWFRVLDKLVQMEQTPEAQRMEKKLIDRLKKHRRFIWRNRYFTWQRKAALCGLCLHREVYRRMVIGQRRLSGSYPGWRNRISRSAR